MFLTMICMPEGSNVRAVGLREDAVRSTSVDGAERLVGSDVTVELEAEATGFERVGEVNRFEGLPVQGDTLRCSVNGRDCALHVLTCSVGTDVTGKKMIGKYDARLLPVRPL